MLDSSAGEIFWSAQDFPCEQGFQEENKLIGQHNILDLQGNEFLFLNLEIQNVEEMLSLPLQNLALYRPYWILDYLLQYGGISRTLQTRVGQHSVCLKRGQMYSWLIDCFNSLLVIHQKIFIHMDLRLRGLVLRFHQLSECRDAMFQDLKPNKSPWPDNSGPMVLKALAYEVTRLPLLIYRKSLETGEVPADWRTAA